MIEALLAAGADPNARDEYGGTPLRSAAGSNENPAVIEALVAAGANINALNDSTTHTPLHFRGHVQQESGGDRSAGCR